jgi:RimJ/RimL family protein N-acetyltransferase
MVTLDTERLQLRSWRLDDFDDFAAMMADPQVMRFLAGDGKPLPRFGAWQAFASTVGHWELRGFGMFAVIESATGTLVGRVGPWYPEDWPDFEIGWTRLGERLEGEIALPHLPPDRRVLQYGLHRDDWLRQRTRDGVHGIDR